MKQIQLLLLIMIMSVAGFASAQQPANPIRWRVTVKMTSATEGEVQMRAVIGQGWHLYGTDLPKNGPQPTSFSFEGSKGVKFVGKPVASSAPLKKHDDMFDIMVSYWEGKVVFSQKFTVTDKADPQISGVISYMGCNDQTCMPPKKHKFNLPVVQK